MVEEVKLKNFNEFIQMCKDSFMLCSHPLKDSFHTKTWPVEYECLKCKKKEIKTVHNEHIYSGCDFKKIIPQGWDLLEVDDFRSVAICNGCNGRQLRVKLSEILLKGSKGKLVDISHVLDEIKKNLF